MHRAALAALRPALAGGALYIALAGGASGAPPAAAQAADRAAPSAQFRFSKEAGRALRALWEESVAAREERVACLGASVRDGTVFISRVLPLEPEAADSMGISAIASIERCGPPAWSGTVHTHVAAYSDDGRPSTKFSGQDRTAQRMWYDRWRSDALFCVIYSAEDAHCEADGVVGGLRSPPRRRAVR